MIDSKLTFKIQEISDGKSSRKIVLGPKDLDLEDVKLKEAKLDVDFEKTIHFIKVDFSVDATIIVTCDRSLEEFDQQVQGSYEILFKPEVEEIAESAKSKVKQFDLRDLTLSIDQEVRDTILLELPVKKLHPRFLDEEGNPLEYETKIFGERNAGEEKPADPRWNELKKFKNKNK